MTRQLKPVDMTALIDVLASSGQPPIQRHGVAMGCQMLKALAEVIDLPMDCYGVDISVRIDEAVNIAVHRRCTIKPKEEQA